mgnify:CR=1 FL=1
MLFARRFAGQRCAQANVAAGADACQTARNVRRDQPRLASRASEDEPHFAGYGRGTWDVGYCLYCPGGRRVVAAVDLIAASQNELEHTDVGTFSKTG